MSREEGMDSLPAGLYGVPDMDNENMADGSYGRA